MYLFVLSFLLIGNILCAPEPTLRLYGSKRGRLRNDEFPYMAALQVNESLTCGATIIREDILITAAHCVDSEDPSKILIRAGNVVWENSSQKLAVRDYKIHENYTKTEAEYDVALIRLSGKFVFNKNVNAIKLAEKDERFVEEEATILGWGETETLEPSDILQQSSLVVLSTEKCNEFYKITKVVVTDNMICGYDFTRQMASVCQGDSGGPLVLHVSRNSQNDTLIGVASWNIRHNEMCDPNFPSGFASISVLRKWIDDTLEKDFKLENNYR